MPTIVVFTQARGTERLWVPERDVEYWLAFWAKQGAPAVRLETYKRRGFFPATDDEWGITLRPSPHRTRR